MGLNAGRSYATRQFSRSRSSVAALPRPSGRRTPPPLITPSEAVTWVVWTGLFHASSMGIYIRGSNMYGEWKATRSMRNMLEELDSKKKESPEAYLEMMEREIMRLKPKLYEREGLADWEVKICERKVAALESRLHAWIKGEDTGPAPAPAPRGYLWQNEGFVYGCG